MQNKLTFNNFYFYLIMVSPALLFFSVFFFLPIVASFFLSMTNFNGININFKFLGLLNYKLLFSDNEFVLTLKNTLIFSIMVTVIQNFIGLVLALILNTGIKTRNALRTLLFTPAVISPVVIAYVWSYIYDNNGVINNILIKLGLEKFTNVWLGDPATALLCIIFTSIWMYIGFSSVIFLANLQSISADIMEAAAIDGASGFNKFIMITFPLMAPSTTINILMSFIGSLKVFDLVYAMTKGGPGHYSEVMSTLLVQYTTRNQYGYAASISVMLFIITFVLSIFILKYMKAREDKI